MAWNCPRLRAARSLHYDPLVLVYGKLGVPTGESVLHLLSLPIKVEMSWPGAGNITDPGWNLRMGRDEKNKELLLTSWLGRTQIWNKRRRGNTSSSMGCFCQRIFSTFCLVVGVCDKGQQGRLGQRLKSRPWRRKVAAGLDEEETLCVCSLCWLTACRRKRGWVCAQIKRGEGG